MLTELSVMEQRYQAVLAVVRDGRTVTDVAEEWSVSRQSVHAWLARYRDGGLEALADRSHRPKRCPHQIAIGVEARLCEMRGRHPGWGPRRLAYELAKAGVEEVPSRSSIYRALIRNGLIEPKARRRRRRDYKRWERARPMELWQMDVVGGVQIDGAGEHKVVTGVDDHSRFAYSEILNDEQGPTTAAFFERALTCFAEYGVHVDAVMTDNAWNYTHSNAMKDLLETSGAKHILIRPHCPWQNGKVERFNRTLQTEWAYRTAFESNTERATAFAPWLEDYNTQRRHSALGGRPPISRLSPT